MKENIILASASPRRKELLAVITNDFSVVPSDCEENVPLDISADKTAEYLAEIKGTVLFEDAKKGQTLCEHIAIKSIREDSIASSAIYRLFNNAAQIYNHEIYFSSLTDKPEQKEVPAFLMEKRQIKA